MFELASYIGKLGGQTGVTGSIDPSGISRKGVALALALAHIVKLVVQW
jgi:hypothetical protein